MAVDHIPTKVNIVGSNPTRRTIKVIDVYTSGIDSDDIPDWLAVQWEGKHHNVYIYPALTSQELDSVVGIPHHLNIRWEGTERDVQIIHVTLTSTVKDEGHTVHLRFSGELSNVYSNFIWTVLKKLWRG